MDITAIMTFLLAHSAHISVLCNVFAIIGVFIGVWTFAAGSAASRKRATVDFYRGISDTCDVLLDKVAKRFKDRGVIGYDEIKKDEILFGGVKGYLSRMEEFATGINSGVFDIGVFEKVAGEHSRIWHGRFKKVIDGIRGKNRPNLYKEFEDMVGKIEEMQADNAEFAAWLNEMLSEEAKAEAAPVKTAKGGRPVRRPKAAHNACLLKDAPPDGLLEASSDGFAASEWSEDEGFGDAPDGEDFDYTPEEKAAIMKLGVGNREYVF